MAEAAAWTELELVGSLMGPVGIAVSIGVGYGTRKYFKRISERKNTYSKLQFDLEYNGSIVSKLSG